MEVQASRVVSLMDDLKRIVPEVELQMGPLLKVTIYSIVYTYHPYHTSLTVMSRRRMFSVIFGVRRMHGSCHYTS